jgi:protein-S-isoprenylcysteine O-methyltransferase Ste14
MSPSSAIVWIWAIWALSWLIAAPWSSRTEARPRLRSELVYRIVTVAGVLLLFAARRLAGHEPRLWETPLEVDWCFVGLAVLGFTFCWWARIHLGRLWSSSVARKADHHIVDTGPYSLVRHPIYTGIIIAAAATAALEANAIAFGGLVVIIIGFWIKARLEERFLRNELGTEVYDAYASRTGMLFPGL